MYVYEASASDWRWVQKYVDANAHENDEFGYAVALSQQILAVGAWLDDEAAPDAGAAFVFENVPEGTDCDRDGLSDECELALGLDFDCDGNQVLDRCDVAQGHGADCNSNGRLDSCDLASGLSADCNSNAVPDECEVADYTEFDCDADGVLDSCEFLTGTATDCDGDGKMDECAWAFANEVADGANIRGTQRAIDQTVDWLMVGYSLADDTGTDAGAVEFYRRDGFGWTFVERVVPPAGNPVGAQFGAAAALEGTTAFVGAPNGGAGGQGAVYVYRWNGAVWAEAGGYEAPDSTRQRFGESLAVDDGTLLVGASHAMNDEGVVTGGAFIMEEIEGIWQIRHKLWPAATTYLAAGTDVAISGDYALLGAPSASPDGQFQEGAAYVFERGASSWSQVQQLYPPDVYSSDRFGSYVALDGDRAAVAAPYRPVAGVDDAGRVHVYRRDVAEWVMDGVLLPIEPVEGGRFGQGVSLDGTTLLIGANDPSRTSIYKRGTVWSLSERLDVRSSLASASLLGGRLLIPDTSGAACAPCVVEIDSLDRDCDLNGVNDTCDIAAGSLDDCDANRFADLCQFQPGDLPDCNANGRPDLCELQGHSATDCDGNGVLDACDFPAGPPDCNGNGIYDTCDLADQTSADLNANGLPDECEPDCNANGVPDDYEVGDWLGADCNGNLLPDDCDIAAGIETDCNQNGLIDRCELIGPVMIGTPRFSPIQFGESYTVLLESLPLSAGDLHLQARAIADLGRSYSWIDVLLSDAPAGRLYYNNGSQCPSIADQDTIPLPASLFNLLAANGAVELTFQPNSGVYMACPGSLLQCRLEYTPAPDDCNGNLLPDECDLAPGGGSSDANANGLPDECECLGDLNADRYVDVLDLSTLLINFGRADASASDGDLDADHDVDLLDLSFLLVNFGTTCVGG